MAGDWIPMRLDLYEDPAVTYMAEQISQREEVIVGYLHRVWAWASRQCHDGTVTNVTLMSLGRVTSLPDFPQLMAEAGWLEHGVDEDGVSFIRFPNWERWMAQSAKKRILAAKRQSKKRHGEVTKTSRSKRDKSVTTGEERREDKKEDKTPLPPLDVPADLQDICQDWLTYKRERREAYKPRGEASFAAQVRDLASTEGSEEVRRRLQHAMASNYQGWNFEPKAGNGKASAKPVTFGQQRQQNTVDLLQRLKEQDEAAASGGLAGFIGGGNGQP